MRALFKAAALAAVLCVAFPAAFFPAQLALAQAAGASIPPADTIVAAPIGDWTKDVLDVVAAILAASLAGLVTVAVSFLPKWLKPLVTVTVQAALTRFLQQGVNYAIQTVEGAEKGKTLDINVGSATVAVALRYIIDHAPPFLVNLAGGNDKLKEKIIAYLGELEMWLAPNVSPAAVKTTADTHPAAP